MLNEIGKTLFDVEKGNVLEIVKVFNSNFENVVSQVNENEGFMNDLGIQVSDIWTMLTRQDDAIRKLTKGKAGKFGVALMAIGGIAYVIKNERDKSKMRQAIIQLDKDARGCEQFAYTPQEDEGEAEEPIGI